MTLIKRCTHCKKEKPPEKFYLRITARDGRNSWCKRCEGDYARQRFRLLRRQAIEFLGGKCVVCGIDDVRVLQLNHLDGGGTDEAWKKGRHGIHKEILRGTRSDIDVRCANHNMLYEYEVGRRVLPDAS